MKQKTMLFAVAVMFMVTLMLSACTDSSKDITPRTDSTKLWPAYSNGKYGFINSKGTFEIPAQFDYVESFSCGYAKVSLNQRTMFIDKSGKLQNIPAFEDVTSFYNNYAVVRNGGKYGLMNKDFQYSIQPIYYNLGYAATNGLLAAKLTQDGKFGYINTSGETKIHSIYDYAGIFRGSYAHVSLDGNSGVINKSGEYVIQPIYKGSSSIQPVGNSRFIFSQDDDSGRTYGLLDENGRVVVVPVYDDIDGDILSGWNLLLIRKGDKYGYIDKDGAEKIPCQYDRAENFCEGYAFVRLNGTKMMIDESGNIALTFAEEEYLESDGLHNGLLLTYNNGTYYYKDIKGNVVYAWSGSDRYYAPARDMDIKMPADARVYHLGKK